MTCRVSAARKGKKFPACACGAGRESGTIYNLCTDKLSVSAQTLRYLEPLQPLWPVLFLSFFSTAAFSTAAASVAFFASSVLTALVLALQPLEPALTQPGIPKPLPATRPAIPTPAKIRFNSLLSMRCLLYALYFTVENCTNSCSPVQHNQNADVKRFFPFRLAPMSSTSRIAGPEKSFPHPPVLAVQPLWSRCSKIDRIQFQKIVFAV